MLQPIRTFLKVVELGSFSKTANVLNVAPSSVARAVDNLEDELQVTLFERSTRQLHLTDKGKIFYDGAVKLVADADHLKSSLESTPNEMEGNLKVSVFESFGRVQVCPIIPEFLRRYPNVQLQLELENNVVDLYAEDVDISIRIGTLPDSQLKARKLISNNTVVCASPEYLDHYGCPETPEDLHTHNCLTLSRNRQRTYWYFSNAHHDHKKIHVRGNLHSKGGTPLIFGAIHGLGILQISKRMVDDHVRHGALKVLLPEWHSSLSQHSSGDVCALYKPSAYPNPLVRVFIDYLVEKIQ